MNIYLYEYTHFIGKIKAPQWSFVFSLSNEVNRHVEHQLKTITIKFDTQSICNELLYFRINSFYCIILRFVARLIAAYFHFQRSVCLEYH